MEAHFKATYNSEYALTLYLLYEGGEDGVLNELVTCLCPLVRRVFRKDIGASQYDNRLDLEGDALEEVFRVVSGKFLPTKEKSFTSFLWTIIRRSMRDTMKRTAPQMFEFWKVCRGNPTSQVESHADVENRIYGRQFNNILRGTSYDRIRFLGKENGACKFIVDCELGFRRGSPGNARRTFNLSLVRCNYLIRYVRILLKIIAFEWRDDERRDGSFTPVWETSGAVLRTVNQFG